jgi:hypothetical protein
MQLTIEAIHAEKATRRRPPKHVPVTPPKFEDNALDLGSTARPMAKGAAAGKVLGRGWGK